MERVGRMWASLTRPTGVGCFGEWPGPQCTEGCLQGLCVRDSGMRTYPTWFQPVGLFLGFGQISWEQQYEPVGFRLTKPREATWLHIQMRLKAAWSLNQPLETRPHVWAFIVLFGFGLYFHFFLGTTNGTTQERCLLRLDGRGPEWMIYKV